jgi:hypothetical protein
MSGRTKYSALALVLHLLDCAIDICGLADVVDHDAYADCRRRSQSVVLERKIGRQRA